MDLLLAFIISPIIIINIIFAAIISSEVTERDCQLLKRLKEFVYDLYKDRNWFGYILCSIILVCLLPGFILGSVLYIICKIFILIWKLGTKKDTSLEKHTPL